MHERHRRTDDRSRRQSTGAQALVRSLEEVGADVVFGIPGGAILPAYDPLYDSTRVRHILVRHEQGAGHAAEGYAQATGKVGVCMATSGPGATNLVTPIADAYMDSVPMVAITGQVGRADDRHRRLPGGRHLRHHAADHEAQLPRAGRRRHPAGDRRGVPPRLDRTPGPGARRPARRTCCRSAPPSRGRRRIDLPGYHPVTRPHGKQIREAARLIAEARRPGALRRRRRAQGAARPTSCAQLAELTGIPVVTTLMARGAFPDSHRAAPRHARHARHASPPSPRCRRPTCSSRSAPASTTA